MTDHKKPTPLKDRAKEPSSWLGGIVLIGTGIAAWVGKPALADPLFWSSVINVASGLGLIAMPQNGHGHDPSKG